MPSDGNDFDKTIVLRPTTRQKPPPAAVLSCVGPAPSGTASEINLISSELTFGRGDDHDVVLKIQGVSHNHARIYPGDSAWGVQDLGSTNGVFVNESKIDQSWLKDGDVVSIGKVHYRYGLAASTHCGSSTADVDISDTEKTVIMRPSARPLTPSVPDATAANQTGPDAGALTQKTASKTMPARNGNTPARSWVVVAVFALVIVVGAVVLFT